MRIPTLNQIFAALAVSANANRSVFDNDSSVNDAVVVLKNPSYARPAGA